MNVQLTNNQMRGLGAALMGATVATGAFASRTQASDWSCCGEGPYGPGCEGIVEDARCPDCPDPTYCCTDYGGFEKCNG